MTSFQHKEKKHRKNKPRAIVPLGRRLDVAWMSLECLFLSLYRNIKKLTIVRGSEPKLADTQDVCDHLPGMQ